MNLNQKIQSMLENHKNKKRRLSATALLSVLIVLAVVSSLIMPAVSMTMSEPVSSLALSESMALYTATPGEPSIIEGNMYDLMSADSWSTTMSINQSEFYIADQSKVELNNGFTPTTDPFSFDVSINYEFDQKFKGVFSSDTKGPHLGWDLGNPQLTATNYYTGKEYGEITDPNYRNGIAGTYVINNGRVEITLTSNYINYINYGTDTPEEGANFNGTGTLIGELNFEGSISSSSDESGDQKFTINNQEVVIDFPDKYPSIDKTSNVNESNGTIEWTIQINNSNYVDLSTYTLTDDMLKNAVTDSVTISPSDAGTYSGNTITFTEGYKDSVTIKYKTDITPEQLQNAEGSRTNKAELKKGDDVIAEDSETANFYKSPFTVTKSGTPDYQKQGGTYGKKIDWTITVKSEYGTSLEGYIIEDSNIPSSGVTVSPSGSLSGGTDGKWTLSNTGGASSVTIQYTTDAVIGSNPNTAKLYYPSGTPTNKEGSDNVDYKDKKALITLNKNSSVDTTDGQIDWAITISNQNGLDLKDYKITDDMLKSAVNDSFSISPDVGTLSGGIVTLNAAATNAQWITIKYSTDITVAQLKNTAGSKTNTAHLEDPKGDEVGKKDSTPWIEANPFEITKSGAPDYQSGNYNESSHKIQWKIVVTSKAGVSLDNYIIQDENIPSDAVIKVSPSGSLTATSTAGAWKLSGTNGANTVTIEYEANAEVGDNSNTAELKYPDDDSTGKTYTSTVKYKSQEELVGLNKWGNYDNDAHEIAWTINVTVEGGYNIVGYVLYDDMFKNVNIDDIQIAYQPASNYATLDKAAGTLTFTAKPSSDNFNITYKTQVNMPATATATTINVSNGYGPGPSTTSTATVSVPVRDQLSKNLKSSQSETVESSGQIIRTLNWEANIIHDGTFSGLTYTDTLSCTGDASHTITADQIAALKVYAKVHQYDGETQLTAGTDYTVTNSGTDFTITFKDTLDTAGYNYVRIVYSTTATANKITSGTGYPYTYEFSNDAEFNHNSSTGKFTLTRKNPEIDERMGLNVKKSWQSDDASVRPSSAYFKIWYRTKINETYGTWRELRSENGTYLFDGDSGYSSASDYLVTLNSNNASQGNGKIDASFSSNGTNTDLYFSKAVGDTIYLDLNVADSSITEANGCIGFNVWYNGTSYWINFKWEYSGTSSIAVLLDHAEVTVSYNNQQVTDQNTISAVKAEAKKNTQGQFQVWWTNNNNLDGVSLKEAYINSSDSSTNWTDTLTNLPMHIRKANTDGSAGADVYYYYKIEEVNADGSSIENGLLSVDGGSYKVDYSNNNGIGYDNGEITATNTFYRNTQITPQKLWTGDTGSGNGISSVTVQLEYSVEGSSTYYPVKMKDSEYIFDNGGTTEGASIVIQKIEAGEDSSWTGTAWKNLPQVIAVDGQAKECKYRIREIKFGDTEITGNANEKVIADGGYYTISYSIGDGNLNVINYFTATKVQSYTAKKQWNGDTEYSNNRPTKILVHLKQKASDGTVKNYSENPVELTADNNWQYTWSGLPNQSTENGTIITYTYEAVEVQFVYGEKTVSISGNSFATTGDGWYDITYSHQSNQSTITNTFTPISTISITPQKKWVGDTEKVDTDRPTGITLKLQKKLSGNDTWIDVLNENNQPITVSLTSSDKPQDVAEEIWQGAVIGNLPTSEIVIAEDGTSTKYDCIYRLVESSYTLVNGSSTSLADDAVSFKTENGKYTINVSSTINSGILEVTNTFEESIGIEKSVLNSLAEPISSIDISELVDFKKNIDEKDYYVFNWMVKYDSSKMELVSPIVDTLPDGFTLCEDSNYNITEDEIIWVGKEGQYVESGENVVKSDVDNAYTAIDPRFKKAGKEGYYLSPVVVYAVPSGTAHYGTHYLRKVTEWPYSDTQTASYYYDRAANQVYFPKPNLFGDCVPFYTYSIKIECSKLDEKLASGTYSITNNAERYENDGTPSGQTNTATLKIINKVDTKLITKSYKDERRIPGYIKYSIDVNPEGKNLSSGDTIDIQDLFETVSYLDHDYTGTDTNPAPGKKLVDVLMDSITLYEVDANGNKLELPSNRYTLMFQNGDDVSNGAALMKLTIPDETHVIIDYTYKLIANESTPSVKHGCKSSTRVNGRYAVMQPGFVPPAYDKITFSNTAKLISDSASDESTISNQEYEIFKSSGTITTDLLPEIKKVNTGDYTINDLKSSFLFAKYENGKWYYATEIDDAAERSSREVTWSATGVDGTKIPAEALKQINVEDAYAVALDENVLYKLVEVSVPSGYEGSNLGLSDDQFKELIIQYLNTGNPNYNGKSYQTFLDNYVPIYYFAYNSTLDHVDHPSDVAADKIMQIQTGGDIEIPNNELIDIGIQKDWIHPTTSTDDTQITAELYWSYTKDSSKIPSDAVLATAADLGIMNENFSATRTLTIRYDDNGNVIPNGSVWTNLPNGKNSKPIYYYVKETAYKIGGKTYTLDQASGDYKTESGEIGVYKPTYVGNAANADSTIHVKNSYQLMLKKDWKNSANDPLKNIPVEKVIVSIYGIDQDGVKTSQPLFKDIELTAAKNWQFDLTSQSSGIDWSLYKSFVAEESTGTSLSDYVVSCVFNLNAGTGEIVVTNKNTVPTEASVTVNKSWSDGAAMHANESITVTLYQSKTKLTDLSDLSLKLDNLSNTNIMQPVDEDDKQQYQNVILNAENDWSFTWIGLPLEDENQNRYYYYVLENKSGITDANKYTESYRIISQSTTKTEYTVTNTRKAIVIQKQWLDENGIDMIPNDELNIDSITLDVLKKVPSAPADGLNIVALGDSITDGYWSGNVSYPSQLTDLLKDNNYKLINDSVAKHGYSGYDIGASANSGGIWSKVTSDISDDADIVCFIGGTNDIHHNTGAQLNPNECLKRLSGCLADIKKQAPNAVIFVGSIPHFDFTDANGNETKGGTYCSSISSIGYYTDRDNAEAIVNASIDEYNKLIKTYAENTTDVYFVDVCSVINKDTMLHDGCHPSNAGYAAIANAFYEVINSTYTQTAKVGEITLTKDNNWIGAYDIASADASAEYYVDESSVPAGWVVSYENQYQKLGSTTPIIVKNTRNMPKTNLTVQKTWKNDTGGETNRASISLTLLQSTDSINWTECDVEKPTPKPDPDNDDIWIFSYTNLPAEDNAGNRYYYKIEEAPMAGYTTSYGKQVVTPSDTNRTMEIINTAAISLKIKKEWSDLDTNKHLTDTVTFKVYRAVSERTNTGDIDLILEVDKENVGITVNASTKVTANKKVTITQSDGSESVFRASLSEDGKTITITGLAEGSRTITVTDGTNTIPIHVTVSAYKLLLDGAENFTITAGDNTHVLSVKKGDDDVTGVTYSSSNPAVLTVDADGKITTVNAGTSTVTVSLNGESILTQDIEVGLPETFEIQGESTIVKGAETELIVNPSYGTFTWSSSNEQVAKVNADGIVTGIGGGSVVITAKRNDNVEISHNMTVLESSELHIVDYNETFTYVIPEEVRNNVTSIAIEFGDIIDGIDTDFQLYDTNGNKKGSSWISNSDSNYNTTEWVNNSDQTYRSTAFYQQATHHNNNIITWTYDTSKASTTLARIEFYNKSYKSYDPKDKLTIKNITFTLSDGTIKKYYTYSNSTQTTALYGASIASTTPMLLGEGEVPTGGVQLVKEIEISGSKGSWETVLDNLDVYSPSGAPYIYWVVEEPTHTGYDVSYQFSDGNAETNYGIDASQPNADGEYVATVRNTKNQTPGVEMPSTGGEGTRKYYYTGAAMVVLSVLAGSIRIRRRVKGTRMK